MRVLQLVLQLVLLLNTGDSRRTSPSGIVGGQLANPGDFPWLTNRKLKCGGALVHPRWVLTAAHCTYNIGDMIHFNRFNLNLPTERNNEKSRVKEIIRHPLFQIKEATEEHDIALLLLESPAQSTAPARLLTEEEEKKWLSPGERFTIAGWGSLQEKGKSFPFLTKTEVPLVALDVCRDSQHYGSIGKEVYDTNLCAGFEAGGHDACAGDSGGPLFREKDGVGVVAGVVSWGIGCGRARRPGVYTSVGMYREWIEDTLEEYGNTLDEIPSCQGFCGKRTSGCSCDDGCKVRHDCCQDYKSLCVSSVKENEGQNNPSDSGSFWAQTSSCYKQCDMEFKQCSCKEDCLSKGSCCSDYGLMCGMAPTAPSKPNPNPNPKPKPKPILIQPKPKPIKPKPIRPKPQPIKTPKPLSCKGKCTKYAEEPKRKRCWCDSSCQATGDCCSDIEEHCPLASLIGSSEPTISGGSCKGYCGSGTDFCMCDLMCEVRNDCCNDVDTQCGKTVTELDTALSPMGSQEKALGKVFAEETLGSSCEGLCGYFAGSCYCDDLCYQSLDCCGDYGAFCGAIVPEALALAKNLAVVPSKPYLRQAGGDNEGESVQQSCEGRCGLPSTDEGCSCDKACRYMGDCCPNLSEVCTHQPKPDLFRSQDGDEEGEEEEEGVVAGSSCQGACGGASADLSCFCDLTCELNDDCCLDKAAQCGSSFSP